MNLKLVFHFWAIKSIVITLTISIITGVLHRVFLYLFQVIYNSNVFYVEGALSNNMIMQDSPVDVTNEDNIQTLINLLKNDFDEDESQVLQLYNDATENGKEFLIKALRKKYKDIGEWAKRDYEIAFNHVNDVMKNAFGLTDKEIKKLSETSGSKIRFLRYAFTIMFLISCGSFIISLLVLAFAY